MDYDYKVIKAIYKGGVLITPANIDLLTDYQLDILVKNKSIKRRKKNVKSTKKTLS